MAVMTANNIRCGNCVKIIQREDSVSCDCGEKKHDQCGRKMAVLPSLLKGDCKYAEEKAG